MPRTPGEHLATLRSSAMTMTTDVQEFVFTRTFDAPRDRVWRAWTDAEALAQWWGPKNAKVRACSSSTCARVGYS